ncbi:MAG: hypothetical protein D6748_11625 [Calditrichaeota bacterium]|nr:MAG: hypothetical protein D6748_11625 [Calditrichota bacterium]
MNTYFLIAAILSLLMGITHSIMGEKYFLAYLFMREHLEEVGNEVYVNRTTRIAWHLTSIAWMGVAIILFVLAHHHENPMVPILASVIALVFLGSALLSAIGSRGRHLLWIVFLIISLLTWLGI